MLPATSVLATSQRDKNPFIVTTEEYSQNPLSPILYGNFIELGYGLQVEAMYGEMLFNRSFEHFLPYRDINKSWYDLYYDDNDHDKGYEKDWSLFDWYHSGYEYNASHGTSIKYCDTEWLAYNTDVKRDAYNMSTGGEVTRSFAFSKWAYALNLMKNFMGFQRMGDEMMFVNVNNLANTHSQCVMDTPKEGAYLTAAGKAMEFLSRSPASRVLRIKEYDPPMNEDFQVQAAWDLKRQRVILYVCNRTAEKRPAVFDLNALGRTFKTCSLTRLHADSPVAMNNLANQDAIKVTKSSGKARLKKGLYHVEVPAWSFTELILE